jgi:hypothetical protein
VPGLTPNQRCKRKAAPFVDEQADCSHTVVAEPRLLKQCENLLVMNAEPHKRANATGMTPSGG